MKLNSSNVDASSSAELPAGEVVLEPIESMSSGAVKIAIQPQLIRCRIDITCKNGGVEHICSTHGRSMTEPVQNPGAELWDFDRVFAAWPVGKETFRSVLSYPASSLDQVDLSGCPVWTFFPVKLRHHFDTTAMHERQTHLANVKLLSKSL